MLPRLGPLPDRAHQHTEGWGHKEPPVSRSRDRGFAAPHWDGGLEFVCPQHIPPLPGIGNPGHKVWWPPSGVTDLALQCGLSAPPSSPPTPCPPAPDFPTQFRRFVVESWHRGCRSQAAFWLQPWAGLFPCDYPEALPLAELSRVSLRVG